MNDLGGFSGVGSDLLSKTIKQKNRDEIAVRGWLW